MYSTKLTSAQGYNPKNIIFSKPEVGSIPGSTPKISFKRIRIGTKHEDGSTGDLIMETPPNLFSFGLQENRELGTGNVNGYVLPMCLWNKNGATPEEQKFTEVFESIVNQCKSHLLNSKDEIEKYELDASDLKNFNPLYWKKEKGKIVEGTGPVLYIKTMMSKKNQKITSIFINEDTNEEVSPYDLMNKYCFVKGAIKFESVFIGNKISLQLKLYEALVKPMDTERKTLLSSNVIRKVETTESSDIFDVMEDEIVTPPSQSILAEPKKSDDGSLKADDDDEEEDETSDEEDDEEEENETPPPTPPPTTPPPAPTKAPAKKATTTRAAKKTT
jgi:hypothetical protein